MNPLRYAPIINKMKNKQELIVLWEETYKKRRKKTSQQKAIISANAAIYSKCIIENTKSQNKNLNLRIKKPEYRKYEVEDNIIIFSTDKKLLNDFPRAERKGIIKNTKDDFEIELILKAKDAYDLKLMPDMFFVINGDK